MKKAILTIILFATTYTICSAQCDNPYYKIKEGLVMEMTNYDDKDKIDGRMVSTIQKLTPTSTGYLASVQVKIYDKKDKLTSEGEYKMECEDGIIRIDLSSLIPRESMQAFEDMKAEVSMTDMEMPKNLSVGQELKDASFSMKTTDGPIPMGITFDMVDRKVVGKETITTSAGTFDCYKITYNTKSKIVMANMNMKNVQYIAEEVGAVKTEVYKDNGKLVSYSLLTKYQP